MTTYRNIHKLELATYLATQLEQDESLLLALINEYLAQKPKKTRQPPPDKIRCMARVWRDGEANQCMSKHCDGEFCSRHAKPTTTPCKHCSKGGIEITHEFAWQHHGRFDDMSVPSHFLSVQSKKAVPLDTPIICECGQEIAFKRDNCPSCDTPIAV